MDRASETQPEGLHTCQKYQKRPDAQGDLLVLTGALRLGRRFNERSNIPRSEEQEMRQTLTPLQLRRLGRKVGSPVAGHAPVTPRVVFPLEVLGAREIAPQGYDGGVNIALREAFPNGVPVEVDYTEPAPNDTVAVYWGDDDLPADSRFFANVVPVPPVGLNIPAHRVLAGEVEGWCTVTRLGGNVEPSTRLKYLVKLNRPGGNDTDAQLPGNQNMALARLPEDVVENGVGPELLPGGVEVTIEPWENMALYDECELHWGSETLKQVVENESDVGKELVFLVTESVIRAAGDDVNLNVTYKLVDCVYNSSRDSEEWPWAPTTYVEVYANDAILSAPYVLEAGDDQAQLDLDALAGADVTVEVIVPNDAAYRGGTCESTWRGVTVNGTPIRHTDSVPVTRVPQFISFKVPNAVAEQLRGGRAVVYFSLTSSDGAVVDHSTRNSLDIVGRPLQWPAPEPLDLNSDDELPIDTPYPTFNVPVYGAKAKGDQLVLHWSGIARDGEVVNYRTVPHTVTEQEVGLPQSMHIPIQFIAPLDGTRATVLYKVNQGTDTERVSESRRVFVGVGSNGLAPPEVKEAFGGWLDPVDLPASGATLQVPRGNLIEEGDRVTYFWAGDQTALLEGSTVAGPSGDLLFDIAPQHITGNTQVRTWYKIERDGVLVGTSPELPLNIGSGLGLQPPSVQEAHGSSLEPEDATQTLTILVPDDPLLQPDYPLTVTWAGADGAPAQGSYTSAPRPVSDGLHVQIPNTVVAFNLGKTVTVSYTLNGKPSQPFPLRVQAMPSTALSRLVIDQADGTTLNVMALSTATVRVGNWPLIAEGQPVWLLLEGTNVNGSAYSRQVWSGGTAVTTPSWVIDGYRTQGLSVDELKGLKDSSSLQLTFRAALDQVDDPAHAVGFRSTLYTIRAQADIAPTLDSLVDPEGRDVPEGTTTVATSVLMRGRARAGEKVRVVDNGNVKGDTEVNGQSAWSMTAASLELGVHSMKVRALYGDQLESPARTFTRVALAPPTITLVIDPQGAPLPQGGQTRFAHVTLLGQASVLQPVSVFDGTRLLAQTTADAAGVWSITAKLSAGGQHAFRVLALYGQGAVSAPWLLGNAVRE